MTSMESPDDSVNAEVVTVKIIRTDAPPRFVSQSNAHLFGFPSPAAFLGFLRVHRIAATGVGKSRIAAADDVERALRAAAKVRGPRVRRAGDVPDDIAEALAAAGCEQRPKAGSK